MNQILTHLNAVIDTAPKNSRLFRAAANGGVRKSSEFERIRDLPRRVYTPEEGEKLADELTELLRTPNGKGRLRPVQAIALVELGMYGGLLGPMRAGAGKTLVTFLSPYVLNVKRPVLLMPAKLIKRKREQLKELSEDWRVAYWLHFLSYESLSRVSKANWFHDLKTDCILADESHKLKNPKAACTKRVKRHLEANPDIPFISLSGTLTKRSVQDYSHLSFWALRDGSPVPTDWATAEEWGNAIDERPRVAFRPNPGWLSEFADGSEELEDVRKGFQKRVNETPGVVATHDKLTGCSLVLSRKHVEPDQVTVEAFETLRDKWETPDGVKLIGGLDVSRHARCLGLGFYYRWTKPAPLDWLEARKAWAKFVRHTLSYNRSGLDTELQVALACAKGKLDPEAYNEWRGVKETFKPETEAVWISTNALKACAEWLKEAPGICWTEHTAFAHMLSDWTGIPYCGAGGGVDKNGIPIEHYAGKSVIASIRSLGEGRDLQFGWSRNLVSSAPSQGDIWEQLLARTHRDGQPEDEVTCEVISACYEHESAFKQAQLDATYIGTTTGQEQRLSYSDIVWDLETELTGSVWTRKKQGKE